MGYRIVQLRYIFMGETASKSESRESLKQHISAEQNDAQEEENGDIDVLKPTHAVSIVYKSQKQKRSPKSQSHQPPATTKKSPTSTKSNPCQQNLTPKTKSTPPSPSPSSSSYPQIILEQVEREEEEGFEELARHESNPEQANASRILRKVCGQCQFVVECSRAGPLLVPYICYDKYAMRD